MHELSIMHSAMEMALEQAHRAKAARICVITMRVGALSGVVPDALRFAYESLARGTMAEGSELRIQDAPAVYFCPACVRDFQAGDIFAECPACGRPSGELKAGREIELTSMEIE